MVDNPTPSPEPTPSPSPSPTPNPEPAASELKGEPSLLNQNEPAPTGAPESYAEFTAPEGVTYDKDVLAAAAPLLKELNLSQEQAQKLVDFYTKNSQAGIDKLYNQFREVRAGWAKETETYLNTQAGGKSQVRTDIGRALNAIFVNKDGTPDTAKQTAFRTFMDVTGAGDNPAFVEAFATMSKRFIEGRPVTGNGPSEFGQSAPNKPRTAGEAMYPGGPRTSPFLPQSG